MPRHFEKRILPYTASQLYALVADIESYPSFLPWCLACEITEREGPRVRADLLIGFKALRERFTSLVTFEAPKAIHVEYGGGPLAHLRNEWTFAERPNHFCEVTFFVDFEIRSRLLAGLMDFFFDAAFCRMVTAFEKRAEILYGKAS